MSALADRLRERNPMLPNRELECEAADEIGRLERELAEERQKRSNTFDNCMAEAARARDLYETQRVYAGVFAEAVEAMVGGGWLDIGGGAAGLSEPQKKLYAAWLLLHPDRAGTTDEL